MKYYISMMNGDKQYYLAAWSMEGGGTECTWTIETNYKANFPNFEYAEKILDVIGRGEIGFTDEYNEDARWE